MMDYLFGTAGWSYKDWQGIVYPKPCPSDFNHLDFLARDFQFVEVNTSFYRIPSVNLTRGWVKKTGHLDNFSFWIKLFGDFTHKGTMKAAEIEAFQESLKPLEDSGRLAGLLAQFPYSFKYDDHNRDYVMNLWKAFNHYTMAVEFRHQDWNCKPFLDTLWNNNIIWVNIDQPPVSQSLPLTAHLTHRDICYFRLHGRNSPNWFSNRGRDARYDYDYNLKELNEIADSIKKLKEHARQIFISGNNHYKGSAVKNLIELKKLLKKRHEES